VNSEEIFNRDNFEPSFKFAANKLIEGATTIPGMGVHSSEWKRRTT